MRGFLRIIPILLAICAAAFSAEYRPGVLLVKYRPGTDEAAIGELQERKGMTLAKRIKLFGIYVYSFDAAKGTPVEFGEEVSREAIVLNAEPDLIREAKAADPEYANQWSLHNTGQSVNGKTGVAGIDIRWPEANLIYQPKSTLLVGVVDSGITLLHPDLAGSIHSKSAENGPAFNNGLDDDENGLIDDVWGYDWYALDALPLDQNGHGTLVASIIAGTIGNGQGISGITNSVKIRAFRTFDQFGRGGQPKFRTASGASISDSLAAIATAVEDGCKVLNLSYGGMGYSQLEADAYQELGSYDVLMVVAAGNEANNNDLTPTYPASYQAACIISVAAQDRTGGLASFSNYGPVSTDLAAPGTDIRGADVTRRTIHSSVFTSGMNGWSAYRNTGTDYSYAAWTVSGGYLVDRTYGSYYAPWTDTFAKSPIIDALAYSGVRIEYEGMYSLSNDIGSVDLSIDGINWETFRNFTSSGSGLDQIDASDFDLSRFYLRFRLRSDGYSQGLGIAVQGVKVTAINDLDVNNPSYQYSSGTSFSAPIVAGVVAMVWTHQPSLTATQVKEAILKSVRKLPLLDGKVLTGGMVDAEAALKLADIYVGNALPSVVTPPSGGFFLQGNTLTLSVTATQNLPVTYQWRKNGVNIAGAKSATFVIGALEIADSGSYDVVVSSQAGSAISAAAQVTVAAKPPAFAVQPTLPASVMVAGQPYQLGCTPSGTAPFAYQWLKNGVSVAGATSPTLAFASLATADAGSYSVKVSNAAGSVLSNTVAVSVSTRPTFSVDLPATATVLTTNTKTLAVTAAGSPAPTYQWRKDGVDIAGAISASYVVPASGMPMTAIYAVVISNAAGSLESTACHLSFVPMVSVPAAGQPLARNVIAGQAASFTVTPDGTGTFAYQWLKDGVAIPGATNATYELPAVSAADAAIYSVRVTNGAETAVSLGATLSVLGFKADLPTATTVPTMTANTLAVTAIGNPTPTYQWRKDGADIAGANGASYVVPATGVPTTANYSVVISNATGSLESKVCQLSSVTMVSVPVAGQLQPRNVIAGQPVSFGVTAEGTGPFAYQWLKDGVAISGATSATYELASASAADAATYSVRVSNGAGTATSVGATLSVLGFRADLPATATVLMTAKKTLAVTATGLPAPTYQWRKNGVDIVGARGVSYVVPTSKVPTTATYSVVIANATGSLESTACLLSSVAMVSVPTAGRPQARKVVAGQGTSFTVTPAGTGPFAYQWLRNGAVIAGATDASYSVASVSGADAATYSVRVTNGAGTATSAGAVLTVLYFKANLPTAATVTTTATKTLAVVAAGSPTPTYQWLKNGVAIAGARKSTYVVPASGVPTVASYSVVISNSTGSLESTACLLTSVTMVSVPVSGQPQARNVVVGQGASFTVTPTGTGPYAYQWLKNGVAIAGATSATYDVAAASVADAGTYSVTVAGPAGAVTSAGAALSVISPFTISAQPLSGSGSVNVSSGGNASLSVTLAGTGPFTYQWRKNGTNIPGATLATYAAPAGNVEGANSYDVVITGPVSSLASNAVSVATCIPVTISQQPTAIVRALGQPATFSVSAAGTAPLAYQWMKNGVNISGATESSYSIASIVAGDAANYSVKVTGPVGSSTSSSAALTLHVVPSVSTQPTNVYGALGQPASFSVSAVGTGPFAYQWSKDGNAIAGANAATYAIATVGNPDLGRYSVSVSNTVGAVLSQEAEIILVSAPTILAHPTPVSAVAASTTRSYRAMYFGFNHGPEGWSAVPWSGKDGEWPTSGWYWNDQINEGLTESNLEGAAGGGETVSPLISLVGLVSPELRFRVGTAGSFTIQISTDKTNWTPLFNIPAGAATSNDPISVSLAAFAGSSCYLRVTSTSGTWLDEVEIWGTGPAKEIIELSVYADGQGLTYQWYKDGVAITGANSRGYAIADATVATTAGNYTVKVSNAAGSVTSAAAKLGLAPGITTQPVGLNKAAGQAAAFTVVAAGTGPLTYQWFKNGAAISGATTSSYNIAAVGAQHAGTYSVTISNALGQAASQSVALAVVTMPVVVSQPQSFGYSWPASVPGAVASYTFTQGAEGWGPVGAGYPGWLWNDQSIESPSDPDASSLEGNGYVKSPLISLAGLTSASVDFEINAYGGNCTLDVSTDGANWSTIYTYDGSNFANAGKKTVSLAAYDGRGVYLRFYMPSSGAALLDNVEVSGSSRAHNMTVGVSGAGCTYQWFRNGVSISGATSSSYRLPDVALAASAGSYTVKVTNAAGTVTSSAAVIPAFSKPTITSQPASQSVLGPAYSLAVIRNYTFSYSAEGWTYGSNYGNGSAYHWDWSAGAISDRLYGSTYSSYTDTYTQSPWISLLGVSSPVLSFTVYHDLYPDYLDVLEVQASSDGVYWATLKSIYGYGNGVYNVSLAGYQWSGCYLRYRLKSSPLYNAFGIIIYDTVVSGSVLGLGQSASFSVGLSNSGGCTFQWYKDNVAISGANSSTYYIANTYASDAGAYKVVVTNAIGSVTSSSVTLTVR